MNNCGKNPTDEVLKNMIDEADRDKNGTIEFAEFVLMIAKLAGNDEQDSARIIPIQDQEKE